LRTSVSSTTTCVLSSLVTAAILTFGSVPDIAPRR
jgi:hypothetical protein